MAHSINRCYFRERPVTVEAGNQGLFSYYSSFCLTVLLMHNLTQFITLGSQQSKSHFVVCNLFHVSNFMNGIRSTVAFDWQNTG
jgi:hypothetical protein